MSKDSVDQWDTTAANNTDVGGISLAESVMKPSAVNNAFWEIMAQVWAWFKSGNFFLRDSTDETKKLKFDISALTTATTRTITVPDADITLGNLVSSSTDNAIVRFDGTSGAMQNSKATVDDTGSITVTSTGVASLTLNKHADTDSADLWGQVNSIANWHVVLGDTTARSGSNAGADLDIVRHSDTGVALGTALKITRSDGTVTLEKALPVGSGGSGATTLTGVLKGNGTSAFTAAAHLAVADGGTGVGTLTGLVKGNGTSAMTAATAGTDYYAPGSTDVAIADGGTGASTASAALTNLGALPAAGGTVTGDLTVNGVLTGVAPIRTGAAGNGTGGNLRLYSDDGTQRWLAGVLGSTGEVNFSIYDIVNGSPRLTINASSGLVTIGAGALAGGPIPTSSTLPVGCVIAGVQTSGSSVANGSTVAGSSLAPSASSTSSTTTGAALSGTWKNIFGASVATGAAGLWVRTA